MDIAIFDGYSGQGNAKRAIEEITKIFFGNIDLNLEAIVRNENPEKVKVQNLLIETGFTFVKNLDTGRLFSLVGNADQLATKQIFIPNANFCHDQSC